MNNSLKKITLVIPVFNEEGNLEKLYSELTTFLIKELANYRIIFVDDGSSDRSAEIMQRLIEKDNRISLISLSRNWGHQMALTAGLDYADGDYIITMDADLQHPPKLIPQMVETAIGSEIDVLHMIKKGQSRSLIKIILGKVFYYAFKMISPENIETISSDFRLYSKIALDELRKIKERDRFLRGLSVWIGFKQSCLYYDVQTRFSGKPKYTVKKLFNLATTGIFSFSAFPIRVSTYLGILIILFNFLFICFVIFSYIFYGINLKGYTTTIISILFLFSFLFIMLGIIGEYIFRIYQEVKNRPSYIIKNYINQEKL